METLGGLAGLLLTTLLWLTEIHTVVARCEDGWAQGTKACYKYFDTRKQWYDADQACANESIQGLLATTDNLMDSITVTDLVNQSIARPTSPIVAAWIGLNSGGVELEVKDGWQWADGSQHNISDLDLWWLLVGCRGLASFVALHINLPLNGSGSWLDYCSSLDFPYVCQIPFKATATSGPTTTRAPTKTAEPTETQPTKPSNTTDNPTTSISSRTGSYIDYIWLGISGAIAIVILTVVLVIALALRSTDEDTPEWDRTSTIMDSRTLVAEEDRSPSRYSPRSPSRYSPRSPSRSPKSPSPPRSPSPP